MAIKFLSLVVIFLFTEISNSQLPDEPKFAFSWLDDKSKFQAGEIAAIIIKVLGNFDEKGNKSLGQRAFKPTVSVNGKTGNSSYISGVSLDLGDDVSTWKITFCPIMVGVFSVVIDDENFKVLDSSLHFEVEPGLLHPSVCVTSWMGLMNIFEAGMNVSILILPNDAFGNNISLVGKDADWQGFSLSILYNNGSFAASPNVTHIGWIESGNIVVEFVLVTAGNFLLLVEREHQTLNGAPLPFEVKPGPLEVSNCVGKWKSELNTWQIFSKMEILLHQKDRFGNLVSGVYEFDADVVEKETGLSVPLVDLQFEYVEPGIQLLSFTMSEPGSFLLTMSDMNHNKSISSMPYAYTVYVGYCDGSRSVVNGSGINDSVAGESVGFSVYLKDAYDYLSATDVDKLQVQIIRENDSSYILPIIQPREILNGTNVTRSPLIGTVSDIEAYRGNDSDSRIVQTSIFDVNYTPKSIGIYKTFVSCGNIGLNGGKPFTKEVKAGEVNVLESSVTQFNAKVPKQIKNELVVLLLDNFYNPVLSQSSRLKLEITSANTSGFTTWPFVDNHDGTYTGSYLVMEVGTYRMCVIFDNAHIRPCPFDINVYSGEYFPKAYDDTVNVWEDESIAFDALGNDYFAGENASILDFSHPGHGSLLRYGRLLRYTPFKDFSGNDLFVYTISDVNGNLATAAVNISVLTAPPQFASFPSGLQATEDLISPRFGGFSGLEIRYSDLLENISVTLSALSGTVFLSPMVMQFRQQTSENLSVSNGGQDEKLLILQGQIGSINLALQSIQYLGDENFAGVDSLRLSTTNKNGINEVDVPVFVEPVNDPPFINVPEYIMLKSNGDESLIFDREADKFEFSVGDPDLSNFPGGESNFLVVFSVEVTDGFLLTSLPSELINSTELKFMNTFRWQLLQTYAAISKHVKIKARGIRFRGTIKDCNDALQQLFHQGGENGAVLTLKLNDMGNYGCYLDYDERISLPLQAEARVKLIRKIPLSSLAAHVLGSAIVLESLIVFSLGILLLFFTCKYAYLLAVERRKERYALNNPQERTVNADVAHDETRLIGCLPESLWNHHRYPTTPQSVFLG
ncbi:PREDICTED: protein GAMETE EXPRESSED 2 isoform X2 [Tarenaya hassleriana]|uniref:protein GAMETE EXPRESSED 2 isoform X2 n=1 Tax=Tarenaya hassleriana TaxID=28532 RepID=UPI00053C3326|nr:PREDICTED: protein GAMETE EXPRESSED 2 isoform X2 [Tarenaya hassleriana]